MYEILKTMDHESIVVLAYGIGIATLFGLAVWPFIQHRRKLKQLKRLVARQSQLNS